MEKPLDWEDNISTKTLLNTLQNLKSHFRLWFLCTQSNCKRRLAYKWETCCRVRSFQSAWLSELASTTCHLVRSYSHFAQRVLMQAAYKLVITSLSKPFVNFIWVSAGALNRRRKRGTMATCYVLRGLYCRVQLQATSKWKVLCWFVFTPWYFCFFYISGTSLSTSCLST